MCIGVPQQRELNGVYIGAPQQRELNGVCIGAPQQRSVQRNMPECADCAPATLPPPKNHSKR